MMILCDSKPYEMLVYPVYPYLDSLRQHDMKRMPFTLPPSNVPGLDVRFHQPLAATQGRCHARKEEECTL